MNTFFSLLRLWVMFFATALAPCATFAYDGHNQIKSGYDGGQTFAIGYNALPVFATGEEISAALWAGDVFAEFGEFLAAKGGIGPVLQGQA